MATTHPTHQQVRDWMAKRQVERTPPPSPDQIKRELGWDMMYNSDQRAKDCAR